MVAGFRPVRRLFEGCWIFVRRKFLNLILSLPVLRVTFSNALRS